jgi:3(or 17)beta-hydroxysteroid dehydrogenase
MVHNALKELVGINMVSEEDPEMMRQKLGVGEPNDVAHMIVYLASDESKHINGAEMVIDNGDTVI